jgi:hypothetical protein
MASSHLHRNYYLSGAWTGKSAQSFLEARGCGSSHSVSVAQAESEWLETHPYVMHVRPGAAEGFSGRRAVVDRWKDDMLRETRGSVSTKHRMSHKERSKRSHERPKYPQL